MVDLNFKQLFQQWSYKRTDVHDLFQSEINKLVYRNGEIYFDDHQESILTVNIPSTGYYNSTVHITGSLNHTGSIQLYTDNHIGVYDVITTDNNGRFTYDLRIPSEFEINDTVKLTFKYPGDNDYAPATIDGTVILTHNPSLRTDTMIIVALERFTGEDMIFCELQTINEVNIPFMNLKFYQVNEDNETLISTVNGGSGGVYEVDNIDNTKQYHIVFEGTEYYKPSDIIIGE